MGLSVCGSLKEVNIPEGVLYIGNMNLYSMYAISTITFPNSLQLMGYFILKDCRSLKEVHIKAVVPPDAENEYLLPFENMTVPLYVPKGCKEIYQTSKVWSVFSNIIHIT
ncbi:MAG: leucine-rich repeat protein [Prevotella sp.]|nr:leucine-rich repeat protein [Prevotella sp.]